MPKVPSLDTFGVTPTVNPAQEFNTGVFNADEAAAGAKEAQAFGQATEAVGTAAGKLDAHVQQMANSARVTDAMNQATQAAQDLAYNTQTGYLSLKGQAALNRPDGVSLTEEYGQKLADRISAISSSLGNDAQRRMFQMQAGDLATNFHGQVESHMLGEFKDYHLSTVKGQAQLAAQSAALNYNKPELIDQAINGMPDPNDPDNPNARVGGLRQAIYQQGQLQGLSALETQSVMDKAVSGVHADVVETAIENNNPTYAMQYYAEHRKEMVPEDLLKVQGQINHTMDSQFSTNAVSATASKYGSAFQPTDMDRFVNISGMTAITADTESGNRDFNVDGSVVTSPTGAKGRMQVLDSTNKDPGFGVKPAQDDSLEERARVGRDYLGALLQKYGDPAKAWAAYHDGPGAFDDAMKKAQAAGEPANWMKYISSEGQKYVTTNMAKFNSGLGAPQMPTKVQFVQDALNRLGPQPRIEMVQATRELAEKQYADLLSSKKEMGDQALQKAQQALIANGGNFSALPTDIVSDLSRYDPDKYDNAMQFAASVSRGENATNTNVFADLITHPDKMAQMSDADWQQQRTNLSQADFEKLSIRREEALTGKAGMSADSINSKAMTDAVNTRLASIGLNPQMTSKTPLADRERINGIQHYVTSSIYEQQQQLGRKMSPEEIGKHVDQLFNQSLSQPSTFFGFKTGGTTNTPLVALQYRDIPTTDRQSITQQYQKMNVMNPTQEQILNAYRRLKAHNG